MRPYLRLLAYLKPHWPVVVVATVLSLLIVSLEGLNVWVGAGFIEQLTTGRASTPHRTGGMILGPALDAAARLILARETPFRSLVVAVLVLVVARLTIAAARVV